MPKRYDVFLSHNSADKPAVEYLAQKLRDAGLEPFLDKWHLIPGQPWQEALEEALDQSETVAVFVGPSGISPWHNEEMRAALDHAVRTRDEYRVIPVLLPGATETAVAGFLARRTWVDFRPGLDDEDAFARLVAGVLGQPPEQPGPFTLPDEPAPYPGLLPFTAQQADLFFGRTEERDRLLARARESPFVAVVGASGSGKSSLVLAGLLPALGKDWHALTLVPGARPLRALADGLATLAPPQGRLRLADDLEARYADRADGLSTAVSTLLADRPDITTLLIVVDQFEETFTQVAGTPDEVRRQQRRFIANIVDTVHTSGGRVRVVLTLRADFVRHCLDFPDLRALLESNQLLLGPMGEDALREAIVKPVQVVGAMFEKGLVGRLLDDMRDQPAALPLMQFALAQLWQRRHGVWLTHAAYEEIGGVGGALDQVADAVYSRLAPKQKLLARNLFVRLVALGEGASDTRRRVRRNELHLVGAAPEEVDELIGILSHRNVRLIAADAEAVELAHEALIEQWGQLRTWLEEDREALRIQRRLTEAAGEWEENNQDTSYLYRGARLAQAEAWADTHGEEMSISEREFLDASVAARDRKRLEAEQRRQRELQAARQLAEAERRRAEAQASAARRLRVLAGLFFLLALIAPAVWMYRQVLRLQARGEMVSIAGGRAMLGSEDAQADPQKEQPTWEVEVPAFEIERFEVTNRQYCLCVRAGACPEPRDVRSCQDQDLVDYPAVMVNAFQAAAYCRWLGRRLPSEVEWEWAAQGAEERPWPWGPDPPDKDHLNVAFGPDDEASLQAARSHPLGATRDGVFNLAGNAMEWTATPYQTYPYDPDAPASLWDGSPANVPQELVLRGGSWKTDLRSARPTYRLNAVPTAVRDDVGFRCVAKAHADFAASSKIGEI